jgi:hypothetical protein
VSDAALRQQVRERAARRCEYCHLPDWLPPFEPFHLEHIVARQHGGETELGNLAWACHRCNRYKGPNLSGIDPSSQEITPLFHPRRANWTAHFILHGIELDGLTPNGRATVVLLQMNSPRRLERRAELIRLGWF